MTHWQHPIYVVTSYQWQQLHAQIVTNCKEKTRNSRSSLRVVSSRDFNRGVYYLRRCYIRLHSLEYHWKTHGLSFCVVILRRSKRKHNHSKRAKETVIFAMAESRFSLCLLGVMSDSQNSICTRSNTTRFSEAERRSGLLVFWEPKRRIVLGFSCLSSQNQNRRIVLEDRTY